MVTRVLGVKGDNAIRANPETDRDEEMITIIIISPNGV